jgi:hypothetical protein
MWVAGLEMQMTSMSRFHVHFPGKFRTPLHDQDIQEKKSISSFHFCCEFDGRSRAVEVVKKLLQCCWSMWPTHKSVVRISEPFRGCVVFCIQCSSDWKYFQFKDKFYQQNEGIAMGNSLLWWSVMCL